MTLPAIVRTLIPPASLIRSGIVLCALLLTVWSQWLPASAGSDFANEWLRDRFINLQVSSTPESRILVVDIDEASLAVLGTWPWPRMRIAELLEKLIANYDARGIALDIVLPSAADEAGDARLSVLAQQGPIVMAQVFDYFHLPLRIGQIAGGDHKHASSGAIPATGFIANYAQLGQRAHMGNIGYVPDQDGVLRRLPMITTFEGKQYPTLALALLDCCTSSGKGKLQLAENGFSRVPYTRDWPAYDVVPASDIINLSAPVDRFRGRLVLLGSSSLGLTDRVATPLNMSTPGVLVHAAMLSSLLDQQAGHAIFAWPGRWIAVIFSLLLALVAAYTFPRLSALSNLSILAGASLLWLLLAYWISPHDAHFSTTGPLISSLFLLAVAIPFDWQLSQRKSRHLLETLRQYVAREVVEQLLRSDLKDPLAPRQLNVTTLIADMEGYTTQVESLPVEEAAKLTRDFLDCLTRPIMDKHGTLDKYTGDGLVAFWGAPLPIEDHADLALDAAIAIIKEVARLSQNRIAAGRLPLRVRIGIESGVAMAGDYGSSFRSIYTAVGDSVNVASRLEQAARDFPFDIIVGEGTVNRAKRHQFTALGEKLLRGKEKPTTLFTVALPA